MKKKLFISIFVVAFAWLAFAGAAMAKQDIPQVDGTYDVPGHPNLLVRVFVHKAKPNFGKGSPVLPSCNDSDSNAVVKSAGWKLPNKTWDYYLNLGSIPNSFSQDSFKNFTNLAFAQWKNRTDLAKTNINFNYKDSTTASEAKYDQENVITWGSVSSSNAIAVTYTWYDRRTKVVAENDTVMNNGISFPWSWADYLGLKNCGISGAYDAQDILTHELGHWVGLNDHYTSAYANNTMFGYGSPGGEVKKDTLTTGDIAGVNSIY